MAKVTKLYAGNAAENPDNVLEQAIGEYESVIILGFNKDGELDPRSSTNLTRERINWMVDIFKNDFVLNLVEE